MVYILEAAPGATDLEVLALADRDKRILLTDDKDFGELVVRQQHRIPALVLMRTGSEDYLQAWQRLEAAIALFGDELMGRYTILEAARVRSRRLRRHDDQ